MVKSICILHERSEVILMERSGIFSILRMRRHEVIEVIWTADDEHSTELSAKESSLCFAEASRMSADEIRESLFSISDEQRTSKEQSSLIRKMFSLKLKPLNLKLET